MSKTQTKQATQKPAVRAQKPQGAREGPAAEQTSLIEELDRPGQVAGLPSHPTSNGLRRATILRMQRRQGNGYVQRFLAQPRVSQGPDGSSGLQRQPEEEEGPTEAQKAAAQAAAQAAEGNAGQAASQAQQETTKSLAASTQEQEGVHQARQQATQAQQQGSDRPESQAPSEGGPAEGSQQAAQMPSGGQSATQATVAAPAGESGKKAPASPEEDQDFLSVVEQIKQQSSQQKDHPPAGQKAQQAQGAAESPASEVTSKAQAGHVGQMRSVEEPPFDAAGFKAQLMQKIQAMAPKTAKEADDFKSSNKLGGLKAEMQGKMAQEKNQTTGPMKEKSQTAPSTAGVKPKKVTPLQPPPSGSPPQQVNSGLAAPKPKSRAEVEKPLQEDNKSLDQQMAEAEITEEQLANSNEPEFQQALDQKREAKHHAQAGPEEVRQSESEQIAQAKEEATASTQETLLSASDLRQQALNQVVEQQGQTKSADERKRQEVAQRINSIFEKTKANVDRILGGLDAKVDAIFDAGAAAAKVAFENYVAAKMEAYKQRRYGGWLGWARWAKDKLLGMPPEVNAFYAQGRELYLSKMDAVINNVVAIIGSTLSQAKAEVAKGKQEIQEYTDQLPADLRQVGQEASAQIQEKFVQLEDSIDEKQNQLVDRLAQKYQENLQAIDARIDEMKAQNRGLVQKAMDAIGGVIKTILKLKDMLLSVLGSAMSAVGKIIKDPIGFLSNLIGGIKAGLQRFVGNIATHLKKGLMGWLFGALADAGIDLPDSFDLKGILSLAMQVLGLTWEAIRTRAVKAFGERAVAALEKVFDVFLVIKQEGLGGLFDFVKDKVTGVKDMVLDAIQHLVITQVIKAGIQWLVGILGGPAGAFIKAAKAIYDIVMWFINNAGRLASLVQAILGSVTAIASGALGQAAQFIEQSLAKAIPVVIGFLANLLGLGDLAGKIRAIIEKVRTPVNSVVDWILSKARGIVRRLGGSVGGKEGGGTAPGAQGEQKQQETGADKRSSQQKQKDLDEAVKESVKVMKANGATPESVRKKLPVIQSKYKLKKLALVQSPKNGYHVDAELNPNKKSENILLSAKDEEWEKAWKAKQAEVESAMQAFMPRFEALAPDAVVSVRGSLATGVKLNPRKRSETGEPYLFNPSDFDVDAYVVSNILYRRALQASGQRDAAVRGKISGKRSRLPEMRGLIRDMSDELAKIAGNRDVGKNKADFDVYIRSTRNAAFVGRQERTEAKKLGVPLEQVKPLEIRAPEDKKEPMT